jgi:hypothetical protein
MAWIKRNLFFVITVVVGLGLSGYCGYLLFAALGDNAKAVEAYSGATNQLQQLRDKKPYPSKENIQAAEADADRVRAFKGEFLKLFSGFPTPPKLDDRQFTEYLKKTIYQFGAEATNAGVNLNPGYAFGFSGQMDKLSYPAECIQPWMQELEEIKPILHILCNAKINFLDKIKRPQVSPNDTSGADDYTPFSTVTNQNGVVTPYRLEFRAFSAEIADVLAGIAASSNCFIVKAPFITKSTVPLPDVNQYQPPTVAPPREYYRPRVRPRTEYTPDSSESPGRPGGENRFRPRPQMERVPEAEPPPAPSLPVTILREKPLFVTLYIEVVKLKALETNSTPTTPKTGRAAR